MRGAAGRCDRRRRIDIVEHHLAAARQLRDVTERREDRFLGQIGHDAKPAEKAAFAGFEAGSAQPLRPMSRARNRPERSSAFPARRIAAVGQHFTFTRLRRRDGRPRRCASGLQAASGRPAYRARRRAPRVASRRHSTADIESILGQARARRDEPSHPRPGRMRPRVLKRHFDVIAKNLRREGIDQDRRARPAPDAPRASGLHRARSDWAVRSA